MNKADDEALPGGGICRPTVHDVAKLAGVSVYTIHNFFARPHVIAGKTKLRIDAAVRELNFVPSLAAQALSRGRTNTLAFMEFADRLQGPFIFETLNGVFKELDRFGYQLLVVPVPANADPVFVARQLLTGQRCDGIIVHLPNPSRSWVNGLRQLNVPVAMLYHVISKNPSNSKLFGVDFDNEQGITLAVRHLSEIGHRRIAYLGGSPDWLETRERERGFRKAMTKAGLAITENWIFRTDFVQPEKPVFQALDKMWKNTKKLPTAIVCASDWIAASALKAAQKKSLHVPRDLSITGFDNGEICLALEPHLTSVSLPAQEIGQQAVRLLDTKLENTKSLDNEKLLCKLVLRDSTAPLRQDR